MFSCTHIISDDADEARHGYGAWSQRHAPSAQWTEQVNPERRSTILVRILIWALTRRDAPDKSVT
jgi:hypothetical protein